MSNGSDRDRLITQVGNIASCTVGFLLSLEAADLWQA